MNLFTLLILTTSQAYAQRNSNTDGIINDSVPLFGPPQPPPRTTDFDKGRRQGHTGGMLSDAQRIGPGARETNFVQAYPAQGSPDYSNYQGMQGQGLSNNGQYNNPFGQRAAGGAFPASGGQSNYMNLNNRPGYNQGVLGRQAAGVGSQFYCFHCASPRKHARPQMLAAMDQLFNLRFSGYPYDAVNEFCDKPIDYNSIKKQLCRHPYCYAIKFGDRSKGELQLTVRGCAENFMAINPATLNSRMGSAGTCRPLPSNHKLPVRECVCRTPLCSDFSRGGGGRMGVARMTSYLIMVMLVLVFR